MRANWIYFLGENNKTGNKEKIFLYGLSLPTNFDKEINSKPKKIGKVGTDSIYVYYSINSNDYIFNNSNNSLIKFSNINSYLSTELDVINIRKIIQNNQHYDFEVPESPIDSTLTMNIFYTNDFFEFEDAKYLDEKNIEELKEILGILEKDSSQHFSKSYSKRLGCFEFAETQPWAETATPFKLSTKKEIPNKYSFKRDNSEELVTVHLIVYSISNEILLNEIKILDAGINELIFNTEVKNDAGYEYWVFNNKGNLLHNDKGQWILGINIEMNLVGQTIKNVPYEVNKKEIKIQDITIMTPATKIEVNYPDNKLEKEIDNRSNIIYKFAQKQSAQNSYIQLGRWFSTSEDNIINVIKYLNELLGSSNSELIIIDPFFSKESIYPLSHLIKANNISIISCWKNEDPDDSSKKSKENIKAEAIDYLKKTNDYNLPTSRLIWHDLSSESFHDRFMIIKNKQINDIQIFMLSNSLNNLLKRYNFCVLRLENTIKEQAHKYLDELITKCSEDNRVYPEVNNVN